MVQTKKLKDGSRQIILNGKQYEGITKILSELATKTKASAILFADMSGQLISQRGNTENMNTTVLSALAASDFAATAEMAKLVGEEAKFKLLFHEGEKRNVYLSNVGDYFFLVVVFDVFNLVFLPYRWILQPWTFDFVFYACFDQPFSR